MVKKADPMDALRVYFSLAVIQLALLTRSIVLTGPLVLIKVGLWPKMPWWVATFPTWFWLVTLAVTIVPCFFIVLENLRRTSGP